jgi:hypothetical protein
MAFADWIRRVFARVRPGEDAAEREEFGLPDRDARDLEQRSRGGLPGAEGAQAAEDALSEFEAPPDPDP